VIKLDYLKQQTALAEMPLVQKGSRLSVMPVTDEQWATGCWGSLWDGQPRSCRHRQRACKRANHFTCNLAFSV
jgi:hypothetical protein